ncbi:dihydrodipicolinate synthase family protein [Rhizobium sp. LC145]|uniref:dihydrodipicolinate synthase family protein n=1 Tax=Rhizobium sp. LC145 TaxID=1120688 RepID=UPI00062A2625|nr:dihydrodipicolinate synthase family protein [Rhizobium sp. LC145]KKX33359.1 dihydrodipicolinate synthase [Rhizobium sp. LC145]TKT58605.1 dihydrodipicolinate synthase family protein [Rhizobiaceae bacterium LC148]
MKTRFGLSAALTTPFDDGGEIVLPLMTEHAKRCLEAGCDSITLFGTTGEGSSIGNRERASTLEAFAHAGIAPERLVVGVLVDAAHDAAEQAAQALDAGVRNILLAPPSYFKNVADDGVFEWYSKVFALLGAKARDIILYNIPSVTMVGISVELVGRLRNAFPTAVAGVKDSGGDWPYTERLLKEHGDLTILIGDERHLAQGTRLGGQGAISGMANIFPREIGAMAVDGRDDERVISLVEELLTLPVTPAVKALVAQASGNQVWLNVRPPLVTIPSEGRERIARSFEKAFSPKAA